MTSSSSLYGSTSTQNSSSSNSTSLYGEAGTAIPDSSGNLIVRGTLTVNGCAILTNCSSFSLLPANATSILFGNAATSMSIGSGSGTTTINNQLATANYDFPVADGTANQVLITDGAGNLSFADVGSLDTNYNIQADTATGGANLTLVGSDATTDSVKFASGGGTIVTRTDANTITITSPGTGGAMSLNDLSDVTITSPGRGNLFYYDGSQFVNSSTVATTIANNRPNFQYIASNAGSNSNIVLSKNYGATPFTTGDGSGVRFEVDSNSQPATEFAILHAQYSATTPDFLLATSINDGASYQEAMRVSTSRVKVNGDLEVNGGDITTTAVTANIFTTNATQINIGGAGDGTLANGGVIDLGVAGQTWNVDVNALLTQNTTTTQATGKYLNTTQTTPLQIMSTTRKAMKGFVTVSDDVTGAIHSIAFLAIRKTSTADAYITIYAEIFSDAALATFTVTDSTGSLRLFATPLSLNSTDITIMRHSLGD